MKTRTLAIALGVAVILIGGCASEQDEVAIEDQGNDTAEEVQEAVQTGSDATGEDQAVSDEEAALNKKDPKGTYGKGITLTETSLISEILADPEKYENERVLVSGTIVDVCPRRGCWIDLASDKEFETIKVKVTDGVIVFPLSAKGGEAQVEGVVERIELDEEQHCAYKEHECAERGEEFDRSTVTGPLTLWRIRGEGAKI